VLLEWSVVLHGLLPGRVGKRDGRPKMGGCGGGSVTCFEDERGGSITRVCLVHVFFFQRMAVSKDGFNQGGRFQDSLKSI